MPLSFLSSRLSQPFLTGQMLHSFHHPCGPSLDCLQCVHVSHTGEPRIGHSTPAVASPVMGRGEGSAPLICWQYFAYCSTGYHWLLCSLEYVKFCWLMATWVSTSTPGSFLQAAFQLSVPQHVSVHGVVHSQTAGYCWYETFTRVQETIYLSERYV